MVKVKLHIRLVRPALSQVYRPGDWIEGVVHLESHSDSQARAIRLKFNGCVSTDWSEGSSTTKMQHSEKHYVLRSLLTLWGYPKGSDGTLPLPAGAVLFPFRLRLPEAELPASGGYKHGHVRYELKAYVDFPWALDVQALRQVDVAPLVPLASALRADLFTEEQDTLQVGCCIFPCACFGSARVHVRFLRPYLVPGGRLLCTASVENQSRTRVIGVKLSLVHRMQFRALTSEIHWVNTCKETQYLVPVAPSSSFSNLNVDSASLDDSVAETADSKPLRVNEKNPFCMSLPRVLPSVFESRLISSNLELIFTLLLASPCANVPQLVLPAAVAAELPYCDRSLEANDSHDEQRGHSSVLVEAASTGEFPVYFSFDNLDYNPEDQATVGKAVAYPYFRDSSLSVTPLSIDKFDPTWRERLEPVADCKD